MKTIVVPAVIVLALVALTCVPGFAADVAAGKEMFAKKCASCHGANGEGKDAIAKMLKVELKPLGSKEVQAKTDAGLINDMKVGTGKMKPVADLKDKNHQDIVSFLRTLAKK